MQARRSFEFYEKVPSGSTLEVTVNRKRRTIPRS